ncbi:MAG TPA: prepilin-type N-terminal cleavage/methylation domain-containing protein [Candidatus Paceibacterota bacterium]|nr:prepilin-type N-terminal cleavage/methylation domain-containing protein [Candidatus Paceibacterota bacterium]
MKNKGFSSSEFWHRLLPARTSRAMPKSTTGFTLIELMIVIAIIGILITIVLESTSAARSSARDDRRLSDLKEVQVDLAQYYSAERSYPTATQYYSASPGDSTALKTLQSVLTDTGDLPTTDPQGFSYGYYSSDGTSYCVGTNLEVPNNQTDSAGSSGFCSNLSGSYNYTQLPPQ